MIGLYFYDQASANWPRGSPSPRGELEITDLNRMYLEGACCSVERLGRGCAWLDAGTPDSLLQAATFVQTIQSRQGMLVGCPEEVAFRMGWIDAERLRAHARGLGKTELGRVLAELADVGQPDLEDDAGRTARDPRGDPAHAAPVRRRPRLLLGDVQRRRFAEAGVAGPFVQDNHSLSVARGTVRGLHCQIAPSLQGKLVRGSAARSGTSLWTSATARRATAPRRRRIERR